MDDLLFGLQATALGMGIVFGVLALLWVLLTLIARFDRAGGTRDAGPAAGGDLAAAGRPVDAADAGGGGAAGDDGPARDGGPRVILSGDADGLDPRLVAAVTVAILRHEEARRLQAAPAMRSYWPGSLLFASRWVAAGRTRQGQSWRPRR